MFCHFFQKLMQLLQTLSNAMQSYWITLELAINLYMKIYIPLVLSCSLMKIYFWNLRWVFVMDLTYQLQSQYAHELHILKTYLIFQILIFPINHYAILFLCKDIWVFLDIWNNSYDCFNFVRSWVEIQHLCTHVFRQIGK